MLVRMRTQISGTRNGKEWPPAGTIVELPDDEAAQYCRNGDAQPVTTFRDAETAVAIPVVPIEERDQTPLTTRNGPARRKA